MRLYKFIAALSILVLSLSAGAADLTPGGAPIVFSGQGEGSRAYAHTLQTDFATSNFRAEITVTIKGGGGPGSAFFGLGRGEPNGGQYNEPSVAPSLFCLLAPDDFAGGVAAVRINGTETGRSNSMIGDGTHRVRLTWDAAGKRAMFEICRNWDGKNFHADFSNTADAVGIDFGGQGHLFVGGASGVSFADFTVKQISDDDIKSAGFGESFANDPTAGTWLPASPVDHDGIRLLACWYNGSKLAATRTFADGKAQTPGSRWECSTQEKPVEGEPGAKDIDINFKLTDGKAKEAGVAVAFDFADWSADNYVLIPASIYNGNRLRVAYRPYATGLDPADLYKKDLSLTQSDVPRLALEPGKPSKLEVSACNASTPAMCFYNHQTKRAFIMLTEQGIPEGDHILDNVFSIEESPDRSHATFVVSAPGVREFKPEFIGFSGSPDRGVDWEPGHEVHLHFRVYSFEAPDIPALLDKYMRVRKEVTGPNYPRDLIPFSEITRLMTARIDSRFYDAKGVKFYCPEGAPWIAFGWIGGWMDTFPMLALGDEKHLERVAETFDYGLKAQEPSGYFHYAIDANGNVTFRDPGPNANLARTEGDTLFWMIKQFTLMKAQGRGSAIKPEWENSMRKLTDALVATWKKDGQWGKLINVKTGEVAEYNTTGGAMVIGGLAVASEYFHQPEYLKVAKEAADYYYRRDFVNLGMTSGACADILQNAESETAAAFTQSLMALYEITGDTEWLEKSRNLANLCATWTVSYDYQLPPQTELGQLGAKLAGAVWASTQNKHGAPGICTSSGDSLFKIYRATGDGRYAALIRDIAHAHAEGIKPDGEITERLTYCDADSRGSRPGGSTGWNELNGILMAMELPGIYVSTDEDRFFVFDHVEARVLERGPAGVRLEITNPTKFDAQVAIFAENSRQSRKPQGYTAFLNWPKVDVKSDQSVTVAVTPDGKLKL